MVSSASLATDEVYTFGGWRGIYATLISLRVWFGDQRSDMQGCARKCTVGSFNWDGINQAFELGLFGLFGERLLTRLDPNDMGLLLLENGSSKISINRLTESPEKDSVIELGTLYYLMSWHDTSPPHRNH